MVQNADIKVSVVMITYKHEEFIKESIESILSQKTDFDFELIIGNDKSPDNTDEIVKDLIANHPQGARIRYYRNEVNLGVMPNSFKALSMIRGTYFAACEGDDYWIDAYKLQKQVDFMEGNPQSAICFTNTRIEYFDKVTPSYLLNENIEKDVFVTEDLIGEEEIWFMGTASLMFRMQTLLPLPQWLQYSRSGDIPLIILASRFGTINYLPFVGAVYRKHAGGVSLTDYKDDEGFLRNRIFMYSKLNEDTNYKFNKILRRNIATYYFQLLNSKQYRGKYFNKIPIFVKYVFLTFPNIPHFGLILKEHFTPMWIRNISRSFKRILGIIPKN